MKKTLDLVFESEHDLALTKKKEERLKDIINSMTLEQQHELNEEGESLLQRAICDKAFEGAAVIAKNIDQSVLGKVCKHSGFTALHLAVGSHCYALGALLLEKMNQQAIDQSDKKGQTALHAASITNYPDIIEVLVKFMSKKAINQSDDDGRTALHEAVINGAHKNVSQILPPCMGQEAVDKSDKEGETALNYSVDRFGFQNESDLQTAIAIIRSMSIVGLVGSLMNDNNSPKLKELMQKVITQCDNDIKNDYNNSDSHNCKNNVLFGLDYLQKHLEVTNQNAPESDSKNLTPAISQLTDPSLLTDDSSQAVEPLGEVDSQ